MSVQGSLKLAAARFEGACNLGVERDPRLLQSTIDRITSAVDLFIFGKIGAL
jgi:hypothetical protein